MMRTQDIEQERLFQLIVGLANCWDKNMVIKTMESILGIKAVEKDDYVHFDDLAVRFGDDNRVRNLYRIIDGTVKPRGDAK